MARKNLLKGLMDQPDKAPAPADARPRYAKGAIGAVSQTIAELKSRSVNEIDPHLIDAGGVLDRLDHDETDHRRLMESIRNHGQQVPVLVRPNPEDPERFQIVYGRRRVLAMRDLGQPVKAMIRDLDDRELVIAQGQENSARRDLSFVEKANFARQMQDAGYDRKVICDALHIDKTVISRMLSVMERVPLMVVEAVGAAPSIGRDRWIRLADLIAASEAEPEMLATLAHGSLSDQRFEALMTALTLPERRQKAAAKVAPTRLRGGDGRNLGQATRAKGKLVLTLNRKTSEGFDDWLVTHLEEIHRDWLNRSGE